MQLSFPANKQIELSFKVGIAGTSSAPQSVSIVLEKNSTALSFAATQTGDEWKAVIDNPGKMFGTGEVKVSVNVILNNRLFTPMKTTGEIVEGDVQDAEVTSHEEIPTETPAEEPKEMEIELSTSPVDEPKPEEPKPVEAKKPKYESLFKLASMQQSKPAPIKPTLKPAPVKEAVVVSVPIKMQLLKSIEPGKPSPKVQKIAESKQIRHPESLFKLKKSKIIYK